MLWPVDQWYLAPGSHRNSLRFTLALPALHYAFEVAHHADERSAFVARITFGCALLVAAGAADHRVLLANLCHIRISTCGKSRIPADAVFVAESEARCAHM